MTELKRNTRTTVEFAHPFVLNREDGEMPAGRYQVETEEELIPGLSFIAYRRISTTITSPSTSHGVALQRQVFAIEPAMLEAALARDKERVVVTPRPGRTDKPNLTEMPNASVALAASAASLIFGQSKKRDVVSFAPVLAIGLLITSLTIIALYRPAPRTVPMEPTPGVAKAAG